MPAAQWMPLTTIRMICGTAKSPGWPREVAKTLPPYLFFSHVQATLRSAFHVAQIVGTLDILPKRVVPRETWVVCTVTEGVCAGTERYNRLDRFYIPFGITELPVIQREKPQEEHAHIRLLQHIEPRDAYAVLVTLAITWRKDHRRFEAEPLHFVRHYGAWRFGGCSDMCPQRTPDESYLPSPLQRPDKS